MESPAPRAQEGPAGVPKKELEVVEMNKTNENDENYKIENMENKDVRGRTVKGVRGRRRY